MTSYLESELENDSLLFGTMKISSNISLETVATDNPVNHLLLISSNGIILVYLFFILNSVLCSRELKKLARNLTSEKAE